MAKLKLKQKAPAFSALTTEGETLALKDLKGLWVVLYFYPKDNTPGCTIEAQEFSKRLPEFEECGATVIGVSKDSCASHQKFVKGKKLKINLLSDPEAEVQKAYGAWGKKSFMGRSFMGTLRSTYLIDPKGKIAAMWPEVSAKGHAEEVLGKLKESIS
jgi:peroxiredoxin Q/BCP